MQSNYPLLQMLGGISQALNTTTNINILTMRAQLNLVSDPSLSLAGKASRVFMTSTPYSTAYVEFEWIFEIPTADVPSRMDDKYKLFNSVYFSKYPNWRFSISEHPRMQGSSDAYLKLTIYTMATARDYLNMLNNVSIADILNTGCSSFSEAFLYFIWRNHSDTTQGLPGLPFWVSHEF